MTATEKELPKRVFALEEKDLAIEADENNKKAEKKENRFLKKLQKDECFIVATGPSIKQIDISKIGKDKLIWGVNGAIALDNINFDSFKILFFSSESSIISNFVCFSILF